MAGTLKTFWQNLSKGQKIGFLVVVQIFIIIIVAGTLALSLKGKERVIVDDKTNALARMPDEEKKLYENALWDVISSYDDELDKSVIKDAKIRENSYLEEVDSDTGITKVSFLVDIDSIQQTFKVYAGWTKEDPYTVTPIIDCPALGESNYPNSVCHGTYRDSSSLSLYLPYYIESPLSVQYGDIAPDVAITGNEDTHTITITVTPCNPEESKQKAMDYLSSTPIDLSKYELIFEVSSIDSVCKEDI